MVKWYCDNCGVELNAKNKALCNDVGRVTLVFGKIVTEIIIGTMNGHVTWNVGDYCDDCVIKAVAEGTPYVSK